MCSEVNVTIRLEPCDYATYEDFASEQDSFIGCGWIYGGKENILEDKFFAMSAEEQKAITDRVYHYQYNRYITQEISADVRHLGYLSESGKFKVNTVQDILNDYNFDESNSQVDYFNRDFYDSIVVKPKVQTKKVVA